MITDRPRDPAACPAPAGATLRLPYADLVAFTARVFAARGLPGRHARSAAEALCYADLAGLASHGLVNLGRLYLPLLDSGRADPRAEPVVVADRGAAVLLDGRRALGLWLAGAAMDLAVRRAARYGVGLVSVRAGTHFGCAGAHAARAVRHEMIGVVTANCGGQRIVPPPGGRVAMLGTNPLSVAAPAAGHDPFVLDMSTTVVPTGRVRAAARAGRDVPAGWLADDLGEPVTDPAAFERGEAHLLWLGGAGPAGYKGFGLGLMVEVLSALVSGSGSGPRPEALDGLDGVDELDGVGRERAARPGGGSDDDIGYLVMAIAPATLRPAARVRADAAALFGTLLGCPAAPGHDPVGYAGCPEARHARSALRDGVPIPLELAEELRRIAAELGLPAPGARGWPPGRAAGAAR